MFEKPSYEELEKRIYRLERAESERDKALEALQESEERFRASFEVSDVGVAIVGRDGKFLSINKAAAKLLGYSHNDLLHMTFVDVTSPEYAKSSMDRFEICISDRTPYTTEKCYLTKHNRIKWGLTTVSPVFNLKGDFLYAIAHVQDITERKKIEEGLKQNEQRYKKAQRIGQVGNWEYDIKTGKFWGSEEAKRIYGYDHKRNNFSVNDIENCIPDRERVHQALVDLIEKGKPYHLEFEIRPLTGPEKKYILSIAEVVVNESGIPKKVDGVILDITDLMLADEKLRRSEEQYRHLFHSIKDGILVTDTNRNIIDCNQTFREWFGYTKKDIIGRKTGCLYETEEEFLKIGKKIKSYHDLGEKQFSYNINYKKKSGEIFPGETNASYLENDKNETVGFIGIIRDITYRKKVAKSLQKANDELKQKTIELEDTNTALKVLLSKRDQDNLELEKNIYSNYEILITPFLSKLKNRSTNRNQQNLLDILETNLKEIIAPFAKKLSSPMMSLTSSEIQIVSMIKQGFTNKEIAQTLDCSKRTVDTHRENIRKKLNLTNQKINLKTFLSNL